MAQKQLVRTGQPSDSELTQWGTTVCLNSTGKRQAAAAAAAVHSLPLDCDDACTTEKKTSIQLAVGVLLEEVEVRQLWVLSTRRRHEGVHDTARV